MNLFGFSGIFRSASGEFEVNRVVGAFGGFTYVVGAHVFLAWEVIHLGKAFDLTAYCLTFPTGLAAVVSGTAAAVAIKDRNVASSKVIEATGVTPSKQTGSPSRLVDSPD